MALFRNVIIQRMKYGQLFLAGFVLLALASGTAEAVLIAQDQFMIGAGDYTAGSSIVGQSSA